MECLDDQSVGKANKSLCGCETLADGFVIGSYLIRVLNENDLNGPHPPDTIRHDER